jgi:methylmalonyl-CoA/ethylmalonyl-CoA epimerase
MTVLLDRLRQVALMVQDLEEGRELYRQTLGMEACYSEDLSQYGLVNLVLPAGNGTFVELLQPASPQSAGTRFLERRGEGPYLLIFETKQYDRLIDQLKSLEVRITSETREENQRSAFIHPSATNGAFVEIIEVSSGSNPWPAAGPEWQTPTQHPLTRQLRQVAVLVRDLDQATQHWEEMFGLRATARFQVSFTDLEIAVLPLASGDTFIELAQPTSDDTSSARYLERYGEGIYLVIYQIDDSLAMDSHLQSLGLRYSTSRATANYTNLGFNSIWLHPSAMKGTFTQLSQVLDNDNPWPPAGDSWHLDAPV